LAQGETDPKKLAELGDERCSARKSNWWML